MSYGQQNPYGQTANPYQRQDSYGQYGGNPYESEYPQVSTSHPRSIYSSCDGSSSGDRRAASHRRPRSTTSPTRTLDTRNQITARP